MILALLLGLCLGCGLWLVLVRLPFMRPLSFADRMAPHLRSGRTSSRMLSQPLAEQTPFGPLGNILGPALADLARFAPYGMLTHGRLRWEGPAESLRSYAAVAEFTR